MKLGNKDGDLTSVVTEVATWDRSTCAAAWTQAFKINPPNYASITFMQRVLAHELQNSVLGGHSARIKRAAQSGFAR